MAKKHRKEPTGSNAKNLKPAWAATLLKNRNLIPIVTLLILLTVFYHEVLFGGKSFLPPDRLTSNSVANFLSDSFEQGEYPEWNPYIYGGMPSFASLQSAPYIDLLGEVMKLITNPLGALLGSDFTRYFSNYLLWGVLIYLLIVRMTSSPVIALFAAIVMVFQPPVVAFGAYGHGSKLTTAALIPVIFLLLDELLEKRKLGIWIFLAFAIGSQLLRAHTQMAYYTFLMIGLYLIYWVIYSKIRKAAWADILKPVALAAGAIVTGVVMSAWLYLPVLQYADYSIRGGGTGLDYGYATNWSFSPAEIMTFLVPSFLGFGGQTYWGQMPFTDFPLYMGIVPLMLAVIAPILKRDKYTIFFSIMGILALIISFGKSLPLFYDLLFNFLPFFNKFRVPSMILILLQFSVAVLAAISLKQILDLSDEATRDKLRKSVYACIGICGAAMLFMFVAKSNYLGWIASSGKGLGTAAAQRAYEIASTDAVKAFFLAAATGTLILLYLKSKIKANALLLAVITIAVVDLWFVGFILGDPKPRASKDTYFAETEAVRFLKTDNQQFRIYQAYDDKPENWYMYHRVQNMHGYQTARLRIYDEFLERTLFLGPRRRNRYGLTAFLDKYFLIGRNDAGQPVLQARTPTQIDETRRNADNAVLDMLNVKYLISYYPIPDPRFKPVLQAQPSVFENTEVLPRAFFVDSIKVVHDDDAFYSYLSSGKLDPASEAVLHETFDFEVEAGNNNVSIERYSNKEIKLKANVSAPALMVLSEVHYPEGWRAYVNGEETKIYRTNGILRSIKLDPGTHEIRFAFSSNSFNIGLSITAATVLLLIGLLIYEFKFRKPVSASAA